jgi:hypothetical protein
VFVSLIVIGKTFNDWPESENKDTKENNPYIIYIHNSIVDGADNQNNSMNQNEVQPANAVHADSRAANATLNAGQTLETQAGGHGVRMALMRSSCSIRKWVY